jgi:hypothetical protein
MEKIWFIIIDGKKEGPYHVGNLKRHVRLTPDTLAWREGLPKWLPIRQIPELKNIFKDEASSENAEEDITPVVPSTVKTDEETLALSYEPPSFYFWVFIGALIILYTFYQWFNFKS